MATLAPEVPTLARDRAFESLYRRYVKDVYHYALALLRNPADAEDVTQTTFMNAYRAYKRGERPIKPHNWLIKIAHNAARTRYAAASRRVKEVPLEDHLEQLSLPEEDRPDIEAILSALARLPLNQRAAIVLRELEGRTYVEIADTLAMSVPAVETLIFRARRSLRLRASAIRGLAIVPLPGSLAQLLESGTGVAVGGSAFFGSGFLFKALVAIVAGAVATGVVGGSRTKNAPAAEATPGLGMTPFSVSALSVRPRAASRSASPRAGAARAVDPVAKTDDRPGRVLRPAADASPAAPSTASTSTGGSSQASAPATAQVTSAVDTVTTVATSSLPTLPVSVPQLPPPPPVSLPPPPQVPSLP
jgi:RNA polymerase sigma factor (sigma-70 family)